LVQNPKPTKKKREKKEKEKDTQMMTNIFKDAPNQIFLGNCEQNNEPSLNNY
jgi:hypothetical protein